APRGARLSHDLGNIVPSANPSGNGLLLRLHVPEAAPYYRGMKLASLKHGRDGRLVVVSDNLTRMWPSDDVVPTMQAALDDWDRIVPVLADRAAALNANTAREASPFDPAQCAAPLPRAYQWADGSVYLNHMELVRRARGATMPESFLT